MVSTSLYAGIGSRETPDLVLVEMQRLASHLAQAGYTLRSGAAEGADRAFEEGCVAAGGPCEIWLPWRNFNRHADTGLYPTEAHHELAARTQPAWRYLSRGARDLHARNMGQVLGMDLATPVQFVVCWTRDGCESEATRTRETGGTGGAIALASRHGIPIFNLANPDALDRLWAQPWASAWTFTGDLPADTYRPE